MKNENQNMSSDLRQHIAEICGSEFFEAVTPVLWKDGTPFQIWQFSHDIEFEGKIWRCLIITRDEYDPEDLEAVVTSEDVLSEAWII